MLCLSIGDRLNKTILYCILIFIVQSIHHTSAFAGYDDGVTIYSYNRIPGCGCFSHCTCFSHYALPPDTLEHPQCPEDILWHKFMNEFLTAKRKLWFLKCDYIDLRNLMNFYHENNLCMLDEYIDCIEFFKRFYKKTRLERIALINKWYPSPNDALLRKEKIDDINNLVDSAIKILDNLPSKIIPLYKNILTSCFHVNETRNIAHSYNAALVSFIEGNWNDFAHQAERLIQLATIHNKTYIVNSGFYQKYGESQLQVHNYHKAIEALSIAIAKNPNNKEAYFQRAIAYFEIGDFDQAIVDYLFSGKSKEVNTEFKISLDFEKALLEGLIEGGEIALIDFFPSIWDSVCGVGQTFWAFVNHPIDTTTNFYNSCYELAKITAEYCKSLDWDTLEEYAYEMKILCEKFDSLTDSEKGQLIGVCIGKYGIDIFAGGAAIKSVSVLKKIKDANRICNLEAMATSSLNKEIIATAAKEYAIKRSAYFKNVKYNFDAHHKHILGHNDYDGKRSIWTHHDPESLLRNFGGKGIPERGHPGVPGYKETVDFGEVIGIWKSKDGKKQFQTTRGTIHYGNKGGHIVPVKPEFLLEID